MTSGNNISNTVSYKIKSRNVAAKDLRKGDKVLTIDTGNVLTVSYNKRTENKSIIVFNGDLEIDIPHYQIVTTVE